MIFLNIKYSRIIWHIFSAQGIGYTFETKNIFVVPSFVFLKIEIKLVYNIMYLSDVQTFTHF